MSLYSCVQDLRKYRLPVLFVFIFCMVATLSFLATSNMDESSARASAANFNPGNIMSDAVMGNYNSMSKDEIQAFLRNKGNCNNTNYNLYLQIKAQYPNTDWHFENGKFVCLSEEIFGLGNTFGSSVPAGEGQTAAEIIYEAAQDYHINPQVLIVLLEKEQSLISDSYPNSVQYRSATGYGCPDTAACDTKYYGFRNQVRNAAALFRSVLDGGWSNYPAGKTSYIQYNPTPSCGGSQVYIENRATSALYRYTPYQPNSSALAAGYGTGDLCGAYGNRNFYLYFTDWFGDTRIAINGQNINIANGVYTFVSAVDNNRTLGVSGNNIQLSAKTDNDNSWRIERDDTGNYKIIHMTTGKYLTTASTSPDSGTNVQLSSDNTCAALWKIYQTADKYLTFESACSGAIVLDVDNASNSIGTNIQSYLSNNTPAQKWSIFIGQNIQPGVYSISSKLNSSQTFDIYGGLDVNGTNVTSFQKNNHTGENQAWIFSYSSTDDAYTLTNSYTGKVLNLADSSAHNGANINVWQNNSSCAQKWQFIPQSDDTYIIQSLCAIGKVIDLYDGQAVNGSNVLLWSAHSGENQNWLIEPVKQQILDGMYTISSKYSDKTAFDIVEGSNSNGANVTIYQAHGGENQLWQVAYNSSTGDYTIVNPATKKALSLDNSSIVNGTNVLTWSQDNTCSKRWYIYRNDAGYYRIITACQPRMAIDLYEGSIVNGSNITIFGLHNGDNQQWNFNSHH